MELRVEPAIFQLFPGMRIATAVAHGIQNVDDGTIAPAWQQTWREAGAEAAPSGNAQSHPHTRPWRERLRGAGIPPKEFPCSIEAMLRRAMKGGEAFAINPLVDLYNTVAMRHIVPAGGYDLDDMGPILELRHTREGDTFHSLDADGAVPVPLGEIAYADGNVILTRQFVWKQAREGLITPATRSVLLLSEVLGEVGETVAEAVLQDLRDGLERHFGVTVQTAMLDAGRTSVVFD